MDIRYELKGLSFVWNARKAAANPLRHDGISFEQATKTRDAPISIPERIKNRLSKDRPMTSITLRIPMDVVESLKEIAPLKGF